MIIVETIATLLKNPTIREIAWLVASMLCITLYRPIFNFALRRVIKSRKFKTRERILLAAHLMAIILYCPVLYFGTGELRSHIPAGPKPECERSDYFDASVTNGGELSARKYIDKCRSFHTSFVTEAFEKVRQIEYRDIHACFLEKKCVAEDCIHSDTLLTDEEVDGLRDQAKRQIQTSHCDQSENHQGSGDALPTSPFGDDQSKVTSNTASRFHDAAIDQWINHGLNASTRETMPIAIIAPQSSEPGHFRDQSAAGDLSDLLSSGLNIVNPATAALFVEVHDVHTNATPTGRSFHGTNRSQWDGTATIRLRVVFSGTEKVIFMRDFHNQYPSDSEDSAERGALRVAVGEAAASFLDFANSK